MWWKISAGIPKEKYLSNFTIIKIKPDIVDAENIVFTFGNAANSETKFFSNLDELISLKDWNWFFINNFSYSKMFKELLSSEVLIPNKVHIDFFDTIYIGWCYDNLLSDCKELKELSGKNNLNVPVKYYSTDYRNLVFS